MRKIRPKAPSAVCPGNCVTVQAGGALKNMSPCGFFSVLIRWLLLSAHPGVEICGAIHIHPQKHLCVLCPAELGALTEKYAGLVRIQPHIVYAIRNQVRLACKLRN